MGSSIASGDAVIIQFAINGKKTKCTTAEPIKVQPIRVLICSSCCSRCAAETVEKVMPARSPQNKGVDNRGAIALSCFSNTQKMPE
jgi:uncharacterized protein YlaI